MEMLQKQAVTRTRIGFWEEQGMRELVALSGLDLEDGDLAGDYGGEAVAAVTGDALGLFLRGTGRFPLLTREEEVEPAGRIAQGDLEAKERMINSNPRLRCSRRGDPRGNTAWA